MNTNEGSGLRGALSEAEREREAVKQMFREDTGADSVRLEHSNMGTTVHLVFRKDGDGEL